MNPAILFGLMLKAALFSFSGTGNVPILYADLLARGWATDRQFAEALAIGQVSPGPTGLWVISLGYLVDGPRGALIALLAIVIPPVAVLAVDRIYARVQDRPAVEGFVWGLGLAVAYSVIKRHNGHIAVESVAGKGTAVHVYLPVHRKEREAVRTYRDASRAAPNTILFMDDEKLVRDVNEKILRNLGYRVVLAENGEEAIRLYRAALGSDEPFDAVILDLEVKEGMGGQEAMREILSLDPHVKAIICSGYTDDPAISDYADYGFKGALRKPHKIDELKALLQRVVLGQDGLQK